MLSIITAALNVHLNLNQSIEINTTSIYMTLDKLTNTSLSSRLNASRIHFPSNIENINDTVLVRVSSSLIELCTCLYDFQRILQPLALGDSNDRNPSYTNLSRSFSLSILDENGKEIPIQTNDANRIEFFIPRDPNLQVPAMFLQNVTSYNETDAFFNYHSVNLTRTNPNLTYSVHFELHPLHVNVSYLFIYQFDAQSQFHSMHNWTFFCPRG